MCAVKCRGNSSTHLAKKFPSFFLITFFITSAIYSEQVILNNGFFSITFETSPFSFTLKNPQKTIIQTTASIPVQFTEVSGQKDVSDAGVQQPWQPISSATVISKSSDSVAFNLIAQSSSTQIRFICKFLKNKTISFKAEVLNNPKINRIEFRFVNAQDDRYYGMGERFDSHEHHGKKLRCWCTEGDYFPIPYFYSSQKNYSYLIDDTHYSEFDFGNSDKSQIRIVNWNNSFNFLIFGGNSPLEILEEYTSFAGRTTILPKPWVFTPWVSANGAYLGKSASATERVKAVADLVQSKGIPCGAIWSDDWDFNYAFNYAQVVKDLHNRGLKALGYRWPYMYGFLPPTDDGKKKGFLTMCGTEPCGTVPLCVQADLTTPQAREWAQDNLLKPFFTTGGDGWMHDFGEYTPATSTSADGRTGWAVHNEYPRFWAQIAREFWDKNRPDGDWIFFMRSGYTGSWKYAPAMWTGDQGTDWMGLQKVVPALQSISISGFPITSTDIGGYLCLLWAADRELYYRWTQLGAFTPIMREHNGYYGCSKNFRFDQDSAAILHWKKYAELHTRLFPYIYTMANQAKQRGYPVIRPLILHHSGTIIPEARQNDQFLLGDRILVAPVLNQGAKARQVFLPSGAWIHYWSGKTYQGGSEITIDAPLEEIPIFIRSGSVLPMYNAPVIHTLAQESLPQIQGFTDVDKSMEIKMYGSSVKDTFTLWDSTKIICNSGNCTATGGTPRSYTYTKIASNNGTIHQIQSQRILHNGISKNLMYDIKGRKLNRKYLNEKENVNGLFLMQVNHKKPIRIVLTK